MEHHGETELCVDTDMVYRVSSWVACTILFVLMLAATQVGFLIGRRVRAREGPEDASPTTTIQAAVLGLLALLLGFSFSMAMTRYDTRKRLVVEEANAIGTTYLRAKMLPADQSSEICDLLRRYVDARLELYEAGVNREALLRANDRSERLQRQLWARAIEAVRANPRPVPTGMFVQTLNDVIDDHAKRVEAYQNQVPSLVFIILYLVAILSMGLTGHACGLTGHRNLTPTINAAFLIALVVFMVNDLDRPRQGIIRVNQQSMIDLRDSMDRGPR
jgi:hypothetical protein